MDDARVYFVHSYRAVPSHLNTEWVLTTTNYGDEEFISSVQRGNIMATQFHPEKSGGTGLVILKAFLDTSTFSSPESSDPRLPVMTKRRTNLAKRIIAYVRPLVYSL